MQMIPPVYRWDSKAGAEAEAAFRAAFEREHEIFMKAVQRVYRHSKLNQATVQHVSFGTFLAWLQKQHPPFPCATNLAQAWALGESGQNRLEELIRKLRQAMQQPIRADESTVPTETGGAALVFAAKSNEAIPELEAVEKRSRRVLAHEFFTLSEARSELLKSFSASDQALAGFLARHLKENCIYDQHLTERMQKKKAAAVLVVQHFEPGDVIIQTAQVIDARAKAILEAFAEARAAHQKQVQASRERAARFAALKEWVGGAFAQLAQGNPVIYALWLALIGLLVVFWFLRHDRRITQAPASAPASNQPLAYTVVLNPERNETIFLPVKERSESPAVGAPATPAAPVAGPLTDAQWQQRARETEKRAEELLAMVRAGLAPHLAKELMNRLVQELIAQRHSLLQTHEMAGREIAALERRFNAINEQLQQQLRAQEQRAQELEGKLASKDQVNSELLKAMILAQKKLHSTQSGNTGQG